jgi:hypothetical protein
LSLCFCVVLSCVGRGLCDWLITRLNESYRVSNCMCDHRNPERGPVFQLETTRKWKEGNKYIYSSIREVPILLLVISVHVCNFFYQFVCPLTCIMTARLRREQSRVFRELIPCTRVSGSRSNSIRIVSDYGLDDRAIEVRFPAEAKGFLLQPLCADRL